MLTGFLIGKRRNVLKAFPIPGTFIVGTDGTIRSKFFLEGYQERIDPESIRQALQKAK